MSTDAAISVNGLKKSYGPVEAVKGIDFEVFEGEVFGLLGPNGAGKTTTVEILEGLRPRTGGEARVLGFDPERQTRQLKDRIGVCLQATNLPEKIKVQAHAHLQSHIEDVAHLDLEFADGMNAHIHVSWLHPCKIRRITIIGDARMVVYDDTSAEPIRE